MQFRTVKQSARPAKGATLTPNAKLVSTHGKDFRKALDSVRKHLEVTDPSQDAYRQPRTLVTVMMPESAKIEIGTEPARQLYDLSLRRVNGRVELYASFRNDDRGPSVTWEPLKPTDLAKYFPDGTVDAKVVENRLAALLNKLADARQAPPAKLTTKDLIKTAGERLKRVLDDDAAKVKAQWKQATVKSDAVVRP